MVVAQSVTSQRPKCTVHISSSLSPALQPAPCSRPPGIGKRRVAITMPMSATARLSPSAIRVVQCRRLLRCGACTPAWRGRGGGRWRGRYSLSAIPDIPFALRTPAWWPVIIRSSGIRMEIALGQLRGRSESINLPPFCKRTRGSSCR